MQIDLENSPAFRNSTSFRAGAAQVDITPPLGTIINGDFIAHYANNIHDPLYAKALVLQNQETSLALVVVDICVMDKIFLDGVKEIINKVTGIKSDNILISSTHTHAAGSIVPLHLGAADLPYRQQLFHKIAEAVEAAKLQLKPAKIGFGAVDVPDHVLCRRYYMKPGFSSLNPITGKPDQVKTNPFGAAHLIDRPAATMDPQVGFLAVKGLDNSWISVLANYSLHYVGDWENGTISADYFGVFARALQKRLGAGADFVAIMSNGTSGEANTWDFLNPDRYPKGNFEKSELIGNEIAEKVALETQSILWQTNPELHGQYLEYNSAVRKPSAEELETARKLVISSDYANFKISNENAIREIFAREQVLLNEHPDVIAFPIQVIKIGDGMIGALGGEFFAETGLKLKEASPVKHYFTISLANGFFGYVPPAHEIEKGGYETWRCRTSFLTENAEAMIREKLTETMHQVGSLVVSSV